MAVRVLRFEIYRVEADDVKSVRQRWHGLADQCQRITNFIWRQWLVWHTQNNSPAKIRKYLDGLAKWRENKDAKGKPGEKPKLELQTVSNDLSNALYAGIAGEFKDVNARVQVLLLNSVKKKIKERKAAKGNLSGWMAILLDRESVPSSTRPQPIPFDAKNVKLVPPADSKDNWRLRLRIDRLDQGDKMATSNEDVVQLLTKRRGIAGHEKILQRIALGEHKFCGSSLYFDRQKRKWFALVCYDKQGEVEQMNPEKAAVLRPGLKRPWMLRYGRTFWRGGHGRHVAAVRHQLLTQRWGRQDGYRFAGSANKGHGRERALQPIFRLSKRWKDFVKTCNHQLTANIVRECVEQGIGTLYYFQPTEAKRDTRFLATAGKVASRHDSTGWDWHQVASMLAYKSKEAGIHLVVHKIGERAGVYAEAGH